MLQLRPITRSEADAFIREHHRHHQPPVGALWRQAVHDHARRLVRPWRGYTIKTITHPHFGPEPVEVYAIDVGGQTP